MLHRLSSAALLLALVLPAANLWADENPDADSFTEEKVNLGPKGPDRDRRPLDRDGEGRRGRHRRLGLSASGLNP